MKILLNVIGSVALLLALIGLVAPLLPTTPFLLLASACYLRGSRRMHRWLLSAPLFGPCLREYQLNRTIPLRAKVTAMLMLWPSLLWSMHQVQSLALQIMLLAIGVGVSVFLWTARSTAPCTAPNGRGKSSGSTNDSGH